MADRVWYIQGSDLYEFGLRVERVEHALDIPSATYQTAKGAERYGDILLNPTPMTDGRKLLVICAAEAADKATLETVTLRRLKGFLSRGRLEIRTGHDPLSVFYGFLTGAPIVVPDPFLEQNYARIQFEITVFDPLAVLRQGLAIEVGGSPSPIPIEDAIVYGILKVFGPVTMPAQIIIRRADGKAVGVIPLAGSNLTSTQVLRLDNVDGTIALIANGGAPDETAGLAYLGDTHDFPFHLDPQWGNIAAGAFPTIEITQLGSGAGGEFLFKKALP